MAVKRADIMVVTAHPDDTEFGAAGTIARWIREGKEVVYIVCTNGDKGTEDISIKPEVLTKMRQKEQLAAAKVLGVREVVFLGYPDQGLEDTPEFRKEIVRYIRLYRPDIVLTAHPYRRYIWHRDHRITGIVTLDAIFPFARNAPAYPDLLEQGLKPHKVKEVFLWGALDDINYRSDITSTFDIKIAALKCHKSQVGDNFEWVEKRMREWAKEIAKGEAFKLAEGFHREEILW